MVVQDPSRLLGINATHPNPVGAEQNHTARGTWVMTWIGQRRTRDRCHTAVTWSRSGETRRSSDRWRSTSIHHLPNLTLLIRIAQHRRRQRADHRLKMVGETLGSMRPVGHTVQLGIDSGLVNLSGDRWRMGICQSEGKGFQVSEGLTGGRRNRGSLMICSIRSDRENQRRAAGNETKKQMAWVSPKIVVARSHASFRRSSLEGQAAWH